MMSPNNGGRKAVVGVAGNGHLPGSGQTLLARALFSGQFRPNQSVQLRERRVWLSKSTRCIGRRLRGEKDEGRGRCAWICQGAVFGGAP
jgi:hypothetical protein